MESSLSDDSAGVTASFWDITIVMLLWNLSGCINFLGQFNQDMLSSYKATELAIIQGRPLWATLAFAVAVFCGAFGCYRLLLRKSYSFHLFNASLLGVVVYMVHKMSVGIDFSFGEIIGFFVLPFVVSVFLIWYSKYVERKGWISF